MPAGAGTGAAPAACARAGRQHSHEEAVRRGEDPLRTDDGAAADVDRPVLHADLPGPFGHRGFFSSDDPARNPLSTGWGGEQGSERGQARSRMHSIPTTRRHSERSSGPEGMKSL